MNHHILLVPVVGKVIDNLQNVKDNSKNLQYIKNRSKSLFELRISKFFKNVVRLILKNDGGNFDKFSYKAYKEDLYYIF